MLHSEVVPASTAADFQMVPLQAPRTDIVPAQCHSAIAVPVQKQFCARQSTLLARLNAQLLVTAAFLPSTIPASHIEHILKHAVKLCKSLGIDSAGLELDKIVNRKSAHKRIYIYTYIDIDDMVS